MTTSRLNQETEALLAATPDHDGSHHEAAHGHAQRAHLQAVRAELNYILTYLLTYLLTHLQDV